MTTDIRYCTLETEPSDGSYTFVCPRQTGSHLEELRISARATLSMVDVLESCPKLEFLKLSCPVSIDLLTQPWQLSPALSHLELSHLHSPILRDHVLALQDHCPSLESLVLHPCHDSSFFSHLHQRWPSMKELFISTQRKVTWTINRKKKRRADTPPGLRQLYIDDLDAQHYNPHDIHSIIVNNCETLEFMFLAGHTQQDIPPPPPDTVTFPRLQRLYYWARTSPIFPCFGSWIPLHAPVLHGIDLNHGVLAGSPALVDILCNLQQLRSLAYRSASGCTTSFITKVLNAHKNDQSKLLDLVLNMPAHLSMNKSLQDAICGLKNLGVLSLGRSKDTMTSTNSMELFMNLAKHCGELRGLEIKMKTDGLDDGVLILATLGDLNRICLRGDQLSNTGLLYLTKYPALQNITLYNTSQAKFADDFKLLKQHIPDLNVWMTKI